MLNKYGRTVFAIFVSLYTVTTAHAGADTLKEWADNEKLYKKIVTYGHSTGNVKKMKQAGMAKPKRVGLISFYLWDNGSREFNAMAYAHGGTYEKTAGLTPKGANLFATKLAEAGVPALKKTFAAHGMELLEPVEFVTSDEQRQAYVNFELPMGGVAKAALEIAQWIQKTPNASSAAAGYKGIPAHLWSDATMQTALEELRKTLGLDALAVLANISTTFPKSVMLNEIWLNIYGPNPVPKPDNRLAAKFWAPGMVYTTGQFAKGFKEAELAKMKKGEIQSENYEGYGRIVEVTADEALKIFDEQYENK